jgi:uncharacterized protein (DUF1015 family)
MEIALIKGILYDPQKVKIDHVIAPPYDVISPAERDALEALDPHNCVRLILPRGEDDEKYAGAARALEAWLAEGVLKRDARSAIYRYHQVFQLAELGGRKFTRRGLIAAVRLHAYDEKVVLPHERTMRGPKLDRLKLMRACQAHFSQIFALYRDPSMATDQAFAGVEMRAPDLAGATADGTLHKLWRVTDRETISQVGRLLAPMKAYIADGHHRYETMLALRDELRAAHGNAMGPRAAPEYATFFLTNMADPGLVVLPTHRLVHSLPAFDHQALLARAAEFFRLTTVEGGARPETAAVLKQALHDAGRLHPTVALVVPGEANAWLLSLQTDPRLPVIKALQLLDVSLLHGVILERYLGIDREAQEAQRNLTYVKDTADALGRVARGEAQAGFIMNPTRVDQVLDVADHGGTMPQKSTFFYPKIASGLVIVPIPVDEDLDRAM